MNASDVDVARLHQLLNRLLDVLTSIGLHGGLRICLAVDIPDRVVGIEHGALGGDTGEF